MIVAGERTLAIKVHECPLHLGEAEMCLPHSMTEKTTVEQLSFNLTCRIDGQIRVVEPA